MKTDCNEIRLYLGNHNEFELFKMPDDIIRNWKRKFKQKNITQETLCDIMLTV